MRLRNNPDAEKILNKSELVIKKFPYQVDSNTIIELGMGKGEMITELARLNPSKFYIGIEKYPTVAWKALKRAENNALSNLKFIVADIKDLDELIIGKVNTIWLTFSDPWPKNRHFKRRLTYKDFLDKYKKVLSKEGTLKLKSDNDKFYERSLESIKEYGMKLLAQTRDFHKSKYIKGNVMTGYEKKWSEQGKNINYLEATFK